MSDPTELHRHRAPLLWATRLLYMASTCLVLCWATASYVTPVATAQDDSSGQLAPVSEDASSGREDTLLQATQAAQVETKMVSSRIPVLMGSLTVFVLAIFIGFEVINKVPPTLHTPLMSGSNAISGITVVGAIIAAGFGKLSFGTFLGTAALVLAMINAAGGFLVTHRMLSMFKKR